VKVQDIINSAAAAANSNAIAKIMASGLGGQRSAGFSMIMDKASAGMTASKGSTAKNSYANAKSGLKGGSNACSGISCQKKSLAAPSAEKVQESMDEQTVSCGIQPLQKADGQQVSPEIKEAVTEDIRSVLKEEFQITDEQLEEALAFLGFTELDLLIPQNVKEMALYLTGTEELSGILTDDGLFDMLTQALERLMPEAIAQDADVSSADIHQLILQNQNTEETTAYGTFSEESAADGIQETVDTSDMQKVQQNVNYGESEHQEIHSQQASAQQEAGAVQTQPQAAEEEDAQSQPAAENGKSMPEVTVIKETKEEAQDSSFSQRGNQGEQQNLAENLVNNIATAVTQTVAPDGTVTMTTVQMRQVVVQVVQQIRVFIHSEQTSMQMTLHPENLGRLQFSVTAAKNGAMTANFVVQNETVRQALEAQIQDLKDAFHEQGLRVESVEVTVSSFEFAQSNESGSEQGRQPQQKRRHDSSIDMEKAFSEDVFEQEQEAAAAISGAGGNVDYTA